MTLSKKTFVIPALVGALLAAAGGFYGFTLLQAPDASHDHAKAGATYLCPMHPQITSDKPGECPLCGMDLVKAQSSATSQQDSHASEQHGDLHEVVLSPEQVILANVKTEAVQPRRLEATITAPGRITYDETRLAQITARFDGRIETLSVAATGARVSKGQPIGTIYSPEAVATMQEYLVALRSYEEMRHSEYPDLAEGSKSLLDASRQRLKLWGLTDAQIAQLQRSGSPSLALSLHAPATGVVLKKWVQPGQYVKTGDVLYEVADLSQVWAEADVFEGQMNDVKVGHQAVVTSPSQPGKSFTGTVSFVYPFLNPETRSMKVRITLSNPDGALKPDMFVTASLRAPGSEVLAVPASAVLDTGKRQVVYVEASPGTFRPRDVRLGNKVGAYYPVLEGLEAGEKVATSGGFLIDANSQIQAGFDVDAEAPVHAGGQAPAHAHGHGGHE